MNNTFTFEKELGEKEANSIAEKVLEIDSAIVRVGIVSHVGFRLGGAVKKSRNSSFPGTKEELERAALRVGSIMGSAKAEDRTLGAIESVILVRRDSKALLFWIPRYAMILVITLVRSANDMIVIDKIKRMFEL